MEQRHRQAPRRVAATVRGECETKPVPKDTLLESVDAWQDVIVNKPGHCIQCNAELRRGQRAYRGLSQIAGAPPAWLCTNCIDQL